MPETQRYRVTEKIDAGGMAEVYRGIAESAVGGLKKAIAIKKILPSLTKNKKFISMFLDEARVSMHLQHANIVGVFDIGIADTSYFIVMEFVDGANLKTILESLRRQNKRLAVQQALYLMMEVCKGLHYAHDAVDPENGRELGIVHRDISPPNILISKRGEVKLVDFGLAKATSQLESTDPGVVKGKFSYLSPEAASGKEVDRRADIFAVGILLYELLTGKRLFYGETDYQTVELVRQAKVPPLGPQNAEVTPELEQIIRKALARDLHERFQTAADLQDALAQFLFSQRLKVTSRDIERLVQACISEKQRSQPKHERPVGNLIDQLINEEILKFTSLDGISDPSISATSPSPTDAGNAPLDPGSFIDTRGWVDDLSSEAKGKNGVGGRRKDASAEVTGLEDLLEGDGAARTGQKAKARANEQKAARAAVSAELASGPKAKPAPIKKSGGKLLLLLVGILLLAGAGATVYFVKPSLLGLSRAASSRSR
ncbi:MAG TPA: serine/threonine-protein kinase [Polyangia bacterium]|jgi:serine/threonine-protein kinase